MSDEHILRAGQDLYCPHCKSWHALEQRNTTGTDYERAMLYYACQGRTFFAGTIGSTSRWPVRPQEPRSHG